VSTNLVYDHWRRKRREREGLRSLSWGPAAPAPVTLGQDLSRVFDGLRPRDRALLWLAHVEGRSHAEVGAILGLRAMSVRVLLFRARAELARRIRRAGLRPEEGSHDRR
jgi:RNA polymerase sigma-70 factor (ECF subfamily)